MNNLQQRYIDFNSFEAIYSKPLTMNQLVQTYQNIFSDPALWDEQYTEQEVLDNLQDELSGAASIRLCVQNNEVLGFCWAQRLNYSNIAHTIKNIKYYQALGNPDIHKILYDIIGDEPIIYLHDLGIASHYRGQLALNQLICPVLMSLSERTNINKVFFWSIENTRVFKLAERAGFKLVATKSGMQFFIGELKTSKVQDICETN